MQAHSVHFGETRQVGKFERTVKLEGWFDAMCRCKGRTGSYINAWDKPDQQTEKAPGVYVWHMHTCNQRRQQQYTSRVSETSVGRVSCTEDITITHTQFLGREFATFPPVLQYFSGI